MKKFGVMLSIVIGLFGLSSMAQAYCGDGILESGEYCDDGNTVDGDGCRQCTITMVTDNLLLYYPFDYNTLDYSGNGYDATARNVTYEGRSFHHDPNGPPVFNPAAVISANSALYVNIPPATTTFPKMTTISFWMKREENQDLSGTV